MYTFNFEPAKNREGLSRGTFLGVEEKRGISKSTGRPYSLILVKFEVLGKYKGTTATISLATGSDKELLAALVSMGWEPGEATDVEVIDDDGVVDIQEVYSYDDFVKSAIGKSYRFMVSMNSKGYYSIKRCTIRPTDGEKTNFNLTPDQAIALIESLKRI